MGTERYINFAEFAKILSLFNPRTGIDEKLLVSTMHLILLSFEFQNAFIVYFRIFDVNEDKKIDNDDLNKVMRMLFGHKLTPEDMKVLREKIFNEVI